MRYIILAVFFYSLYLFLRFLINTFFRPGGRFRIKSDDSPQGHARKPGKDLDKIEDAEYEEIKK